MRRRHSSKVSFKRGSSAVRKPATKVSVRTTEGVDAVAITSPFGGGGHARAAGCTVDLPLDLARAAVLAECERQLLVGDARGR